MYLFNINYSVIYIYKFVIIMGLKYNETWYI